MINEIRSVFDENRGRYGVRRVHKELINHGHHINHKKVQRLMKKLSLKGKVPKEKYHSYKGNVGKTADNIINRDFSAGRPDEKWTTDVSEFKASGGKLYLSPIMDIHDGSIIAYDISIHPDFSQTKRMIDKAFKDNPNLEGLIFHSDQGWQYQMKSYQKWLKNKGILQSFSRKGNCMDNSLMENFFGIMKNEMYYGYEYKSLEDLRKAMEEYITYYNTERINIKRKGLSPLQFRQQSLSQLQLNY